MDHVTKKQISFVIPCYCSEGSVSLVIQEIKDILLEKENYDYEIIAVNDCSPDNVLSVLRQEAGMDRKVKVIDLSINRGRHNALMCGCRYASGDYIVFIDDDQQCPMDRFWDLLKPLEDGGYDVAIAKYPRKKQSHLKNFGSKVNDMVANWLLGKDKDLKFSNFAVMRKFVRDEVIRYHNPYPYLSGLMIRSTSRVVNVEMEERERKIGTGNYSFKKSLALWMNNFTSFSVKPLRLATSCGMIVACLGIIMACYTVIHKLLVPTVAMGYSSIMSALLFLGGMIMLMLGLIGEYIGRIYISINSAPQYVVREEINVNSEMELEV